MTLLDRKPSMAAMAVAALLAATAPCQAELFTAGAAGFAAGALRAVVPEFGRSASPSLVH